jgi:hypothetical protein
MSVNRWREALSRNAGSNVPNYTVLQAGRPEYELQLCKVMGETLQLFLIHISKRELISIG